MTPEEELTHLRQGAGGAEPPGELDVLEVECAGGAELALRRAREVLEVVLQRAAGEWPDLTEWRQALPAWFVATCVDDAQVVECVLDRWSLRAWVYWFQPHLRRWRWWDAEVSGRTLRVRVLVLSRPYLRGALEWLLKVSAR
ncbi:MAG TPA: hypothetical protein VKY90_12520 [Candidatus Dormibacteraeota bacterium]|nr:hypothetical protein [Candidatus Dormibacteraeota bacterium]